MKKFLIMLIAAAMLIPFAAAADDFGTDAAALNEGYTITWINSEKQNDYQTKSVYQTITQGETDWIYKYINSLTTQLHIDLNWGDTSNSLRLKVYSPDGHTFGYYYDNSDGSINGRIQFDINNPNGIAQGKWRYEVYGYSVSGIEDYYI
ncbi:hypothetical protein F1737_07010 [Methanoplanus sp. FWC-SCC4]|uniref:Peptidase domain-containing protein n=1 Tax=Methanochimaera problematica TaxID=2609417 RepID=A0AA97I411_9EURY|nr:hypothetical protein [Methanoplanus sp. FWC-SCC4]WOF16466.1 hypothetical protein F1737_07010 [Methanoplanus sp. FWC-SCC4]